MRKWILTASIIIGAGTALAQAPAGDVIAQRRNGLKRMNAHLEAIKPVVDAHGPLEPLLARVDDMIAFYTGFPALFPPGSDVGDTKARPEVWSNRAGFEAANAAMVTQLGTLRTVLASGNGDAAPDALRATGQACGGCHRNFRLR